MKSNVEAQFFHQLNRMTGSRQTSRLSPLFKPGYINVDERDTPDLIRAMAKYAENVHFYSGANKKSGKWSALFENSEILTVAKGVGFNAGDFKTHYQNELKKGYKAGLVVLLDIFSWLNGWMGSASYFQHHDAKDLLFDVKTLIAEKINTEIKDLLIFAKILEVSESKIPVKIDSLWKVDIAISSEGGGYVRKPSHDKFQLILDKLVQLKQYISDRSAGILNALLNSANHDPAISMLIAFLMTYKISQEKINKFTQQFLKFYYTVIHQNIPEYAAKEIIFLQCEKAVDDNFVHIAKGTKFYAGKFSDMSSIFYEAVDGLTLSGAKLGGLHTIFLQRDKKISPSNATKSVTRLKSSNLFSDKDSTIINSYQSVFGSRNRLYNEAENEEPEFGLCVSSNTMCLGEGRRKIVLELETNDELEELFFGCKNSVEKKNEDNPCDHLCPHDCKKTGKFHLLRKLADSDSPLSAEDVGGSAKLKKLEGIRNYRLKFARDLYQSFPDNCKYNDDLAIYIYRFSARLNKKYIFDWLLGDRASANTVVKKALLYLYSNVDNRRLFENVHRLILIRRILDKSYLAKSEKIEIEKRIHSLPEITYEDQLFKESLRKDIRKGARSLLHYYLGDAFTLKVSSSLGWLQVNNYQLRRLKSKCGFCLELTLEESAPPIVPPSEKTDCRFSSFGSPVLQVLLNPLSRVFAYSYLRSVLFVGGKIKVEVSGVRNLSVYNEYGKVDTTKPFQPFSTIPSNNSTLYIGGYEYARKTLSTLKIQIRWKNLPVNYGGFEEYYRSYGSGFNNDIFKANLGFLADGNSVRMGEHSPSSVRLFDYSKNTNQLYDNVSFDLKMWKHVPVLSHNVARADYENKPPRHAYLSLRLSATEKAFGHQVYPAIMSDVLTYNNRHRKKKALPRAPYTPEINYLAVDYTAEDEIKFVQYYPNATGVKHDDTTRAFHVVPNGLELAEEISDNQSVTLLPRWNFDGNLYIGFRFPKNKPSEYICLYFCLRGDGSQNGAIESGKVSWSYYCGNKWKRLLPSHIMSDSTCEFLRSGIVTIKLPLDLSIHHGLTPKNQYWLKASSSNDLEHYASLQFVGFDALTLQSSSTTYKLSSCGVGISDQWRPTSDIVGVQAYVQHESAAFNSATESELEATVRLYERLRHKNRAVTPWDFERLILEKFPQIEFAKCLPSCQIDIFKPVPGHVLVVVTPKIAADLAAANKQFYVDSILLKDIALFLQNHATPGLEINVVNARYESVQVRCAVLFNDSMASGQLSTRLKAEISAYLSPWQEQGVQHSLGWVIRASDLKAHIQKLDYVRAVSKIAMLKIFETRVDSDHFTLIDTAEPNSKSASAEQPDDIAVPSVGYAVLEAEYPWTLPISTDDHEIEILNEGYLERAPEPVGIKNLEIGSTFIVRGISSRA